tara:strand:+ start:722 stop:4282 length:3561 start_codon:yes stop_codon:yes gene_type:complete
MGFIIPLENRVNPPQENKDGSFTIPNESRVDPTQTYEDTVFAYTPEEQQQILEDPEFMDYVVGYGGELITGEGFKIAGSGIGSLVGPKGTVAGYIISGLYGGYKGSEFRQNVLRPGEPLDKGELVADMFLNLIPGIYGKGKKLQKVGVGVVAGTGAETIETYLSEGTLPTLEQLKTAGISGGLVALGFDLSGDAFRKAYTKFAGEDATKLTEAYKMGDPSAKILIDGMERTANKYTIARRKSYRSLINNVREFFDDEYINLRMLQDQSAGGQYKTKQIEGEPYLKVKNDTEDYYLQRRLANGKIDAKSDMMYELYKLDAIKLRGHVDDYNTTTFNIFKSKGKEAEFKPMEYDQLNKNVTDYLYAKHAIDFNARNKTNKNPSPSGMPTEDAQAIIKQFENSGMDRQFKDLLDGRREMANMALKALLDGGLINQRTFDKLRKTYPNYVPLSNVIDADDIDVNSKVFNQSDTKFEATGTGVKRATGGERGGDINFNILNTYNQAIKRAEVNKANQSFANLIESNPDFITEKIAKVTKSKTAGKNWDGTNIYKTDLKGIDNLVTFYKDGQRYEINFTKEYKDLAPVLKGLNHKEVNGVFKMILAGQSWLGSIYTRWNPDFIAPNLFRDRSEAFVNNLAKMNGYDALKTILLNEVVTDLRVVARNVYNKPATSPKGIEMDNMYKLFKESGGSTGGLGVATFKSLEDRMRKLQKNPNMNPKEKSKIFFELLNSLSEISEDATRFGTFRNAINSGLSPDRAALAARDSSFDPKLMGKGGPYLKSLYLFVNPALQGTKNFLRNMKKPEVYIPVTTTMATASYLLHQHNMAAYENPDGIPYYEIIPEHVQDKNFILITGTDPVTNEPQYLSLPIGYALGPLKASIDFGTRYLAGNQELGNPEEAIAKLTEKTINSYNPAGSSLVPTQAEPFVSLFMTNENGLKQKIVPERLFEKNISANEKVYDWTADTKGGELFMQFADTLVRGGIEVSPEQLKYAYNTYTGGLGKFPMDLFNITSKLYNGEKISPREIPIARRFFGQAYWEPAAIRTEDKDLIDATSKEVNTELYREKRIGRQLAYELMDIKSQRKREERFVEIIRDPQYSMETINSFNDRMDILTDKTSGLAKRLKKESIEVRLKFVDSKISTLETLEERTKFLEDMLKYKVITKDNLLRYQQDKVKDEIFEKFRLNFNPDK